MPVGIATRVGLGTLAGAAAGVGLTWALLGDAARGDVALSMIGKESATVGSLAGRQARIQAAQTELERSVRAFEEKEQQRVVGDEGCWQCKMDYAACMKFIEHAEAAIDGLSQQLVDASNCEKRP